MIINACLKSHSVPAVICRERGHCWFGGNFGFLSWLSSYSHGLTRSSWTCLLSLLFSSAPLLLFANSNNKLKLWGLNFAVDRQGCIEGGLFSWLQGARPPEFRCFRDLEGPISTAFHPLGVHEHASSMHKIFWCHVRDIVLDWLTCLTGLEGHFISVIFLVQFSHDFIACRSKESSR